MKKLILIAILFLGLNMYSYADCRSTVTLDLKSINYSGMFDAELRNGNRPGSRLVSKGKIKAGITTIENVCSGVYFFAFSAEDMSDKIMVTSYFQAITNERGYTNPYITVFYSRHHDRNEHSRVKTISRKDL